MRYLALFSLIFMLGAGCASGVQAPVDDTPESNPENCLATGGAILGGVCACPEGTSADPADFCLDAEGRPGHPPPKNP